VHGLVGMRERVTLLQRPCRRRPERDRRDRQFCTSPWR